MNADIDKYVRIGLAGVLVLGFFGVLFIKLLKGMDVQLEVGALIGGPFGGALTYYFGSNAASARKTELLAQADPINVKDVGAQQ